MNNPTRSPIETRLSLGAGYMWLRQSGDGLTAVKLHARHSPDRNPVDLTPELKRQCQLWGNATKSLVHPICPEISVQEHRTKLLRDSFFTYCYDEEDSERQILKRFDDRPLNDSQGGLIKFKTVIIMAHLKSLRLTL